MKHMTICRQQGSPVGVVGFELFDQLDCSLMTGQRLGRPANSSTDMSLDVCTVIKALLFF